MSFDITQSQCFACKHVRFVGDRLTQQCDAFPVRIPDEIFGLNPERMPDHRLPYDGDHGIRFEPLPGRRHPLAVVDP